ncbi:MAG: Bacterial cell division rane protein [Herbinix sp.]|nr:Bacterial cell division rane protein [Herbinix sp.]
MREKLKIDFKRIDVIIVLAMTALIGIGFYCQQCAFRSSEDLNSIVIKQIAGILIGYALILVILFIDYHIICGLSVFLYLIMISILGLTLIIGSDLNNVKRWIVIFGIPFQPSELTKVALILFLAFLCNYFKSKMDRLYVLVILTAIAAVPMILIILEPHLSSSIAILFIFCFMIYYSGMSYKVIGTAIALVLPVLVTLYVVVAVFNVKIPFIETYQINRVLSFLSTDENDDLNGDYQQLQSIEAIASGSLHGKVISSDTDTDKNYSTIYANESDFVFSIVGEEFGFIGSFFIILFYAGLIARCLIISIRTPDYMGKLICIGVSAYLMFQIFVNVGVATKLLPNTGLPLPFISYGLTSLISSMIAVGLVLNIGIRQKHNSKS